MNIALIRRGAASAGRNVDWATDADRLRIPIMEADVILESTERRIIMDTKYYTSALSGWGGGSGKLHSPNLYQLLAYLRNREAARPDGPKHEGILLYPQVKDPPPRRRTARRVSHPGPHGGPEPALAGHPP